MTRYAAGTDVPADRSRGEIERTLARYGADSFAYGWSGTTAVIGFRAHGRAIRFELPLPDRHSDEFTLTPTGRDRSPAQADAAWEQATRQRWRALALAVKAKLEAVETGIATFEDEFLAYTVLPSGQTFGQWAASQGDALTAGRMPMLLPGADR